MTDKEQILLRVMIAMAIADETMESDEVDAICKIYREITKADIEVQAITDLTKTVSCTPADMLADLAQAHDRLDEKAKEQIIQAAYMVLLSDGVIAAQEKKTLFEMAVALRMPEIHYQLVLEELEDR